MKLTFFDHRPRNFGDDLNAIMWDALLPDGFLDEDASELFVGIGSIIREHSDYPADATMHVMGAGFGGYGRAPKSLENWNFVWVRGPRTAAKLGLEPEKAICDAAMLMTYVPFDKPDRSDQVAFMPHFRAGDLGNWRKACDLAGITFLDPTLPSGEMLPKIASARCVISEAMHGCILADTLRTPWIPALPLNAEHVGKWQDWAESVELTLRPEPLKPSSAMHLYTHKKGRKPQGKARVVLGSPAKIPLDMILVRSAAARLAQIAETVEPTLSKDDVIADRCERALEALDGFVKQRGAVGVTV